MGRVAAVLVVSIFVACSQPDGARDGGSANAAPALQDRGGPVGRAPRPSTDAQGVRSDVDRRSGRAPTESADASRPRIVFLGDSLTAGLGLDPAETITALLQQRLQDEGYTYDVVNAGVSGDTSAGGLSRLDWSLDGDVEILVIELGGNDGLRGLPAAALKQNLEQIIARAHERKVRVLLTGMEAPPNFGAAYTTEFREVFSDLAREHRVPFMPFFLAGVAGNPALNQADRIHPNPAGARVVEANVWQALEPLLDKAHKSDD
jgi:acyl-CoA thioesterase I